MQIRKNPGAKYARPHGFHPEKGYKSKKKSNSKKRSKCVYINSVSLTGEEE